MARVTEFYSVAELESMSVRELELLVDIETPAQEKLVQAVMTKKRFEQPHIDNLYRGDVPDITSPEMEREWQETLDERAEKLRARGLPATAGGEDPSDPDWEKHNPGKEKPTVSPIQPSAPKEKETPETPATDTPPNTDVPALPPGTDAPPQTETPGEVTPPATDTPAATPDQPTDKKTKAPFCAFCDSRGGFHRKNCPTKKVG